MSGVVIWNQKVVMSWTMVKLKVKRFMSTLNCIIAEVTHWTTTAPFMTGAVQWTIWVVLGTLLMWVAVVGPPLHVTGWNPSASFLTKVPIGVFGATIFLGWIMKPRKGVELMIVMTTIWPGWKFWLERLMVKGCGVVCGSDPWSGSIVKHAASGAPSGKAEAKASNAVKIKTFRFILVF